MKLSTPFIQLPLAFDAQALAEEVRALDESAWRPHPQKFPGNSMLPLVAADGDPASEAFAGEMRPTPSLQKCPYLMQALAALKTTVGRTRLMRLGGHAEVTRHADQGYYWAERVRVHVPIVTQPTVRFECGAAAVNMAAGECWIFDTWRQHRVLNDATESRIHLVVDTVGGEGFWEFVAAGRPVPTSEPDAEWNPELLPPAPATRQECAWESVNVPRVMTPWELAAHFGLLFSDTRPHAQLKPVQQITARFIRNWRALWARYGDRSEGLSDFRNLLKRFVNEVAAPSKPLTLVNDLSWLGVMSVMIARVAVSADDTAERDAAGRE